MRTNIWIRKENEAAWNKIKNKSDWVNKILENEKGPLPKPKEIKRSPNGRKPGAAVSKQTIKEATQTDAQDEERRRLINSLNI